MININNLSLIEEFLLKQRWLSKYDIKIIKTINSFSKIRGNVVYYRRHNNSNIGYEIDEIKLLNFIRNKKLESL